MRDETRTGHLPTPIFLHSLHPRFQDRVSFQAGVGLNQPGHFLSSTWQKSLFVVVHTEAILQCRRNGGLPVHPKPSCPSLCRTLCERSRTFCPCILQFCLQNPGFMSPPNSTRETTECGGEQSASLGPCQGTAALAQPSSHKTTVTPGRLLTLSKSWVLPKLFPP